MSNYITISELSKLMNVSVHQIRYFEEKKVLFPAYIDTNQYRMYGLDEIYQLSHILLLRKLHVPVQQIRACMLSYSADDYRELLTDSLDDVQSQIDSLTSMKQFIEKVLREQQEWSSQLQQHPPTYNIREIAVRHLRQWINIQAHEELHARSLYQHRPQQSNLFETDLHYLYSSNQVTAYIPTSDAISDTMLEQGLYLTRPFTVTSEDDIAQEIQQIKKYATQAEYVLADPVILIEKSYLSMFNNNHLHYEIQARIQVAQPETGKRAEL